MQHASPLSIMPYGKNPRSGQAKVWDRYANINPPKKLNVQLPTGYGKSLTALGAYHHLKHQGLVNRLLVVFPQKEQLNQFLRDAKSNYKNVGLLKEVSAIDVYHAKERAIEKSFLNKNNIFCITAHALIQPRWASIVDEMMGKNNWMLVVDEHHHYGWEKSWSESVLRLNYDYILVMSATPNRPENDGVFGEPDIKVPYKEAVEEGAVKKLVAHVYNYRLDAMVDGELYSFTTEEIVNEFGQSSEKIDKATAARMMRWSPKYVSPLVREPLRRMIEDRDHYELPLQAIIGCLSVLHAQIVCQQVAAMFPSLRVDWVGTGKYGRAPEENEQIIQKFCPPKDANGDRNPELDILVHCSMAGEGFDSVLVSEVIHLNRASINNSNNQENGRAARYIEGKNGEPVIGHINFDACSDYAKEGYKGELIMKAMDCEIVTEEEIKEEEKKERAASDDIRLLPDEPNIYLMDIELESIDNGQLIEVAKLMKAIGIEAPPTDINIEKLDDDLENREEWLKVVKFGRKLHKVEAEEFNEKAVISQLREKVDRYTARVVGAAVKRLGQEITIEKSVPGDIKKRINFRKARALGKIENDEQILRDHLEWLKNLQHEIVKEDVPGWLL